MMNQSSCLLWYDKMAAGMLETAKIVFPDFDTQQKKMLVTELQQSLRMLQLAAYHLRIPILIIIDGFEVAGRTLAGKTLSAKMDPRGYKVYPILERTPQEKDYPFMWRYWKITPGKGTIAVYDSSYYSEIILAKLEKKISWNDVDCFINEFRKFEQLLSDSNTLIVKLFLVVDFKEQKRRMKQLDKDKLTTWQIKKKQWFINKHYTRFYQISDQIITKTNFNFAQWNILDANNKNAIRVGTLTLIKQAIEARIYLEDNLLADLWKELGVYFEASEVHGVTTNETARNS